MSGRSLEGAFYAEDAINRKLWITLETGFQTASKCTRFYANQMHPPSDPEKAKESRNLCPTQW